MGDVDRLQKTIGISFKRPPLLENALIHSSYLNENPGAMSHSNERLEFLGDAVLGLIIAEELFALYPGASEGTLTRLRSLLVRRETLARLAADIALGSFLYMGKGEEASGGREKPANTSRAMEALIAAVYLDQGLRATQEFVLRLYRTDLTNLDQAISGSDYKSCLQEIIQGRFQLAPNYHTVETAGPGHEKLFSAEARLQDKVIGRGSGRSKKEAEANAARDAIEKNSNDAR